MGKQSKIEKQFSEDLKILELVESEEYVADEEKTTDLKTVVLEERNPTLVLVESNPTSPEIKTISSPETRTISSPDTVVTLVNSPDMVLVEDGQMDSGDIVDIEDDNFTLTGFLEKVTVHNEVSHPSSPLNN